MALAACCLVDGVRIRVLLDKSHQRKYYISNLI